MSAAITRPGIYSIPAEAYHGGATPVESLSSTGAFELAQTAFGKGCPADFRYNRDNPQQKRCFDIGTSTHLLFLEPRLFADQVVLIQGKTKDGKDSPGYTTADARKKRDAAYVSGKTPLLAEEFELIRDMRAATMGHPIARVAFNDVLIEQSLFYEDREYGIWCRARPDILAKSHRWIVNVKTAADASTHAVQRSLSEHGYAQRAAWEMDAVREVTGVTPDRYVLIVVGKKAPHRVNVAVIDPLDLSAVAPLNRYARGLFAHCHARNEWPPYSNGAGTVVSMRHSARREILDLADAGFLEPPVTTSKEAA